MNLLRTAEYSVCMELKPSAPPLKSTGDTTSIDGPEKIGTTNHSFDEKSTSGQKIFIFIKVCFGLV